MKSHWIEHNGKRIFYADYSGFGDDTQQLKQEMEPAIQLISEQPPNSVLVLANLEGLDSSITTMNLLREMLPLANTAILKRAVLGISGSRRFLQTTMLNVTGNTSVKLFTSRELALDWLASE